MVNQPHAILVRVKCSSKKYKIPLPWGFTQYQIGSRGNITPPKTKRFSTKIDRTEFSNGKIQWLIHWKCGLLSLAKMGLLGCNAAALNHVPFCHHARNYTKRENDGFNNNDIQFVVSRFISCDDLVWLTADKAKFNKKLDQAIGMMMNFLQSYFNQHHILLK